MNTSVRNAGIFACLFIFGLMAVPAVLSLSASAKQTSSQPQQNPAAAGNKAAPAASSKSKDPLAFREDWASLSVENTDLRAAKPLLGNTVDLAQNPFISELYQVQWRPQDAMDLYVIRPRNIKKSPVILYLYTFPEDTMRFKNAAWCSRVTAGGYAAVGFVSALTGQRFHDRPMKEWFISEFQESLGKSVHDVQMVLNYLETRDDLDMTRVGMLGTGSGGAIAIMAAAADPRIKAIDVLNPWGDWPDWLAKTTMVHDDERANFLKPEFLAKVSELDPVEWLPKLTSQHIRIQDMADSSDDPQVAQKAIEAAAPLNAEIDQFGDGPALTRLEGGGTLFEWLKGELKAPNEVKALSAEERVHVYPAQGASLVKR